MSSSSKTKIHPTLSQAPNKLQTSTIKKFYVNQFPRHALKTDFTKEYFFYESVFKTSKQKSIDDILRNKHYRQTRESAFCLHQNVRPWEIGWNPMTGWKTRDRWTCDDCEKDLTKENYETELQHFNAVRKVDNQLDKEQHAAFLHEKGMHIDALIEFAYQHECWMWPTWRVVRDIIVPTTRERGRCRYGELPEIKECFGPATVFMSHCWGSKFGDLVGASCHGACYDRIVWIDIFAVRQWPGNIADLDFRGVIGKCKALVVSTSPIKELKEFMSHTKDIDTFLSSDACKAAKSINPFFRLWCVVELTAAIILDVFVVVKGGMVEQDSTTNEYIYNQTKFLQL